MISVFLDSDGPIADFDEALNASGMTVEVFKHAPGSYLWLPVTRGARTSLARLRTLETAGKIKVWIATKTPSKTPYAYTEKVLWYRKNFPWLEDRVILTHDKSLLGGEGDFLLDDRPHKGNAANFKGTFVYFDTTKPEQSWDDFLALVAKAIKESEE